MVGEAENKTMRQILNRILADPNICFGKTRIHGTRIWVSLILDFLSRGMRLEEIIAEYPQLVEEDVRAAIAYSAEMARKRHAEFRVEHTT